MNYRHAFHAGNFADVFKHVLLGEVVAGLSRKTKPFLYLDTHAGRGRYDLEAAKRGDSLARAPEWPDGIGKLWKRTDLPAAVRSYVEAVREFNRRSGAGAGTLRFYPGSPVLAAAWLREDDRIVATERLGEECTALRKQLAGRDRTVVRKLDGYGAPRAFLPPPERRALVLIDPPFEATDEFERVEAAVREALARLSSAVVCVWYPLTVRSPSAGFTGAMQSAGLAPALDVTFRMHGDDEPGRLNGCGMVILNPPWRIEETLAPVVEYLAGVLGREPSATARVQWLVAEEQSRSRIPA